MKSISRDAVSIHYKTEGDKASPALVMLHGFGNNSQNWYDLGHVDILKQHYYLIMPDVRGFGLSDKPIDNSAYTLENIGQDVLAIMDAENFDSAYLYGNSFSSYTAWHLALYHAERFNAFIFQGVSPFAVSELMALLGDVLKQTKDLGIKAYVDKLITLFDVEFPPHIRAAMELCDPNALYEVTQAGWSLATDAFPSIQKPALAILGEHEGLTEDLEKAVALMPQAELCIIPGLDHVNTSWAGDKVAPVIHDFLSNLKG